MSLSGAARIHRLASGGALNRRMLNELFLQASRRAAQIHGGNIADKQLDRDSFFQHTFEEYYFDYAHDKFYNLQVEGPSPYPLVGLEFAVDDHFTTAEVAWSVECQPMNDECTMVIGWPVIDGQALYSGMDYKRVGPVNSKFNPDRMGCTLGGKTSTLVRSGRTPSGIMLHSLTAEGSWEFRSANISVRNRFR